MNRLLSCVGIASLVTLPVLAADSTWISTSGQGWTTAANWSGTPPNNNGLGSIFQDSDVVQHTVLLGANPISTIGIQFLAATSGTGAGFTIGNTILNVYAGGTAGGIINNAPFTQTLNAGVTLKSVSGFGGVGASQTWNAAAGGLVLSGVDGSGTSTLNLNGGMLTVSGAYNTTIGIPAGLGTVVNTYATGGLTKNGTGTLTLGGTGANTYKGSTIINAGSLVAAKTSALGTSSITLNGGSLVAGAVNAFGTGALTLNGGALLVRDYSQNFGVLTLGGSATLDLGLGTISTNSFADSHSATWSSTAVLEIVGWQEGDLLRFGSGATGLTAAQLAQIQFEDGAFAKIDSLGYITPIPEPAAAGLSLLGACVLAFRSLANRRKS